MSDNQIVVIVISALVAAVSALSGLIGWMIRQYRTDVRDIQTAHATLVEKVVTDGRAERDAVAERHERQFERQMRLLDKLNQSVAETVVAVNDVVDRLERLENRTGEHRPIFERGDDAAPPQPDHHGRRKPA